jgi:hypothetical protein
VKRTAVVLTVGLALALAAPAFAEEGPTLGVYGGQVAALQVPVAKAPKPPSGGSPSGAVASGTLPFTGVELGLFVLAGGVLLGTGLGIRRLTRTTPTEA